MPENETYMILDDEATQLIRELRAVERTWAELKDRPVPEDQPGNDLLEHFKQGLSSLKRELEAEVQTIREQGR